MNSAAYNIDAITFTEEVALRYRNLANAAIAMLYGIVQKPPRRDIA